MIVCDTSGLYAAYNANQPGHRETLAVVNADSGPLIVSAYVLTELDYLLRTRVGIEAVVGMLSDVKAGAYDVAELTDMEMGQAITLIEKYADRNIGIADAANVALAARHRTTSVLTLDNRDYRIIRPLWGDAFTLMPADAELT